MAVTAKPTMAVQVFVPAIAPKKGGKIRFPAPKNMENNVSPTRHKLRFDSLSIDLLPVTRAVTVKETVDSRCRIQKLA